MTSNMGTFPQAAIDEIFRLSAHPVNREENLVGRRSIMWLTPLYSTSSLMSSFATCCASDEEVMSDITDVDYMENNELMIDVDEGSRTNALSTVENEKDQYMTCSKNLSSQSSLELKMTSCNEMLVRQLDEEMMTAMKSHSLVKFSKDEDNLDTPSILFAGGRELRGVKSRWRKALLSLMLRNRKPTTGDAICVVAENERSSHDSAKLVSPNSKSARHTSSWDTAQSTLPGEIV